MLWVPQYSRDIIVPIWCTWFNSQWKTWTSFMIFCVPHSCFQIVYHPNIRCRMTFECLTEKISRASISHKNWTSQMSFSITLYTPNQQKLKAHWSYKKKQILPSIEVHHTPSPWWQAIRCARRQPRNNIVKDTQNLKWLLESCSILNIWQGCNMTITMTYLKLLSNCSQLFDIL
jgi:hypothetical protein